MHGMVEEGIRHLAIRSLDPHPPRREAGRVLLRQRACTLLARASHRDVTDAGRADTERPAARIGVRGASAPTPASCSRWRPACREHAFVGPGSTRRPDPAGAQAEARWFVLVCGIVSLRRHVCRSSAPGEIRLALVAQLRGLRRSGAFGRCLQIAPVDAEASVDTVYGDAELARLGKPPGGIPVHHRRLTLDTAIATGCAIAQHHVQDPRDLVRGGDQTPIAAAPCSDAHLEAGELAVAGARGAYAASTSVARRCREPFRVASWRRSTVKGGTRVRLAAILANQSRCPVRELAYRYHSRWGIEGLFKTSQHAFELEIFHSGSERGVKQEILSHLSLVALARLFTRFGDAMHIAVADPRPQSKANFGASLYAFASNL